jgi:hypothetical protein
MTAKIIINASETVVCPQCAARFPLDQGITRQTMEKYEREVTTEFARRDAELREAIRKDEVEKARRAFGEQETHLKQLLTAQTEARTKAETAAREAVQAARARAAQDFEQEKQGILQELTRKDATLKEFRENELALRKEKQQLEEDKQNLEIGVQRRLDSERRAILEQASKTEADRFRLKEQEYRKQLEDALKVKDELTRKLEQGSQQLQGEVLELELETVLRNAFPHDRIEPVRKGQRGADVLQIVHTSTGQRCGAIIWEAKRAENWSQKWIQKLKDDQVEAKAELAVIVTTSMPEDMAAPFTIIGDVWVTRENVVRPVAQTLRILLLEAHKLKLVNTGKSEKVEALYNYLCSSQFAQRVRAVVETFDGMQRDLNQEKNAVLRLWKKREAQIERVTDNMTGMVGELQAIAHESLPQLESIPLLSLPDGEERKADPG